MKMFKTSVIGKTISLSTGKNSARDILASDLNIEPPKIKIVKEFL